MKKIASREEGKESHFERVPDFVVIEIIRWLVSREEEDSVSRGIPVTSAWQVRNVLSFSSTCKRFRALVITSTEIWSVVDIGLVVSEVNTRENAAAALERIPQAVPRAIFTPCRDLTTWTACGLSPARHLEIIRSMPNLETLSVHVSGNPKEEKGGELDAVDLFQAIEGFANLRELNVRVDAGHSNLDHPAKFPPSLRSIRFSCAGYVNFLGLLSNGPFEKIEELVMASAEPTMGMLTVVQSFPALKSICIMEAAQDSVDVILETCEELQSLMILFSNRLSLEKLETSECAKKLRRIKIHEPDERSVEVLSRSCPNIKKLSLHARVRPEDVKALIALKNLEELTIHWLEESDGEQLSEAFEMLGNAEGSTPFRRIHFREASFNAKSFFGSKRCTTLREISFGECKFGQEEMETLAHNASNALRVLKIDTNFMPLLTKCRLLERVVLEIPESPRIMAKIGKKSVATPRRISFVNFLTDEDIRKVKRFIRNATVISLQGTAACILEVISSCPNLRTIRTCRETIKEIRSQIPPTINTIPLL